MQPMPAPGYPPPPSSNTEINNSNDQSVMDVIATMEGLSDAERKAMMEEQEKILAGINAKKNKKGGNSKKKNGSSTQKVRVGREELQVLGPERTQQAIRDGDVNTVECVNCGKMLQVSAEAKLLYCPSCHTVQPVPGMEEEAAATSSSDQQQFLSDQAMAEKLQQEYDRAAKKGGSKKKKEEQKSSSWGSWLGGGMSTEEKVAKSRSRIAKNESSADNVDPYSSAFGADGKPTGGGLVSACTGEDENQAAAEKLQQEEYRSAAARTKQEQSSSSVVGAISSLAAGMVGGSDGVPSSEPGSRPAVEEDSSPLVAVTRVGRQSVAS